MTHAPKVFLSYSSKDCSEVDKLDLELRRRGVVLWRDRESLLSGRPLKDEIAAAADQAAGFAFYLTMNAARSEWVREKELCYARQNQEKNPGLGIVPIFRDDIECVDEEMVKLGSGGDASQYSLRGLSGYVFRKNEPVQEELRRAAQHVLRSLAASIASSQPKGAMPVIGLATRGASAELMERVGFLVDWTEDFKDGSPGPLVCTSILRPALDSLWYELLRRYPSMRFRLVPRCHVSMALMAGFRFRRNTGATIEVGSAKSEDRWPGPREPLEPEMDAWSWRVSEHDAAGKHLGVAIAVSMTSEQIRKEVHRTVDHLGLDLASLLEAEPAWGGSKTALSGLEPERPHRMAVALANMIQETQSKVPGNHIHLFYAGPVNFAVLLGQQLSNLGAIQLYELNRAEGKYEATFELLHE